ncbi:MAG: hypothetical protein ACREX8_09400 [Gammaproteobacteria bacterium]
MPPRDVVYVTVSADLPIRSTVQPYANRVELRFGKAYPVVLSIERAALDQFSALIEAGRAELDAALTRSKAGEATETGAEPDPSGEHPTRSGPC